MGYALMLLSLLAGGFGVPLPEDVVVITAGFFVHKGEFSWMGAIFFGIIGVLSGDVVIFSFGRYLGTCQTSNGQCRTSVIEWMLGAHSTGRFERLFNLYGPKIVFIARFVPGLRAPTFFSAGAAKVKYSTFLLFDICAAFISVPLWVGLGSWFGPDVEVLIGRVKQTEKILGLILLLGVLTLVARIVKQRVAVARCENRNRRESPVDNEPHPRTSLDPACGTSRPERRIGGLAGAAGSAGSAAKGPGNGEIPPDDHREAGTRTGSS